MKTYVLLRVGPVCDENASFADKEAYLCFMIGIVDLFVDKARHFLKEGVRFTLTAKSQSLPCLEWHYPHNETRNLTHFEHRQPVGATTPQEVEVKTMGIFGTETTHVESWRKNGSVVVPSWKAFRRDYLDNEMISFRGTPLVVAEEVFA